MRTVVLARSRPLRARRPAVENLGIVPSHGVSRSARANARDKSRAADIQSGRAGAILPGAFPIFQIARTGRRTRTLCAAIGRRGTRTSLPHAERSLAARASTWARVAPGTFTDRERPAPDRKRPRGHGQFTSVHQRRIASAEARRSDRAIEPA